jgi:hypothetical protein
MTRFAMLPFCTRNAAPNGLDAVYGIIINFVTTMAYHEKVTSELRDRFMISLYMSDGEGMSCLSRYYLVTALSQYRSII